MRTSLALVVCSAMLALTVAADGLAAPADQADDVERGVIWGGQEHRQPASLQDWLRARGASYELWAERHPAAAARLERSSTAPASGESRPLDRAGPHAPASPVTPASRLSDAAVGSSTASLIAVALLGLGVTLLVLAALLASPLIHAVPWSQPARKLRESSVGLALAGAVIVVSVAVGYAL